MGVSTQSTWGVSSEQELSQDEQICGTIRPRGCRYGSPRPRGWSVRHRSRGWCPSCCLCRSWLLCWCPRGVCPCCSRTDPPDLRCRSPHSPTAHRVRSCRPSGCPDWSQECCCRTPVRCCWSRAPSPARYILCCWSRQELRCHRAHCSPSVPHCPSTPCCHPCCTQEPWTCPC